MDQRRDAQNKQVQKLVGNKTMPKVESLALCSKALEPWCGGFGSGKKNHPKTSFRETKEELPGRGEAIC